MPKDDLQTGGNLDTLDQKALQGSKCPLTLHETATVSEGEILCQSHGVKYINVTWRYFLRGVEIRIKEGSGFAVDQPIRAPQEMDLLERFIEALPERPSSQKLGAVCHLSVPSRDQNKTPKGNQRRYVPQIVLSVRVLPSTLKSL